MRLTKAQVDRLRQLERTGVLTPEAVLADARKPASVLHGLIEWDTGKAALAWQLAQCQRIIRAVRVQVTVDEVEVIAVRYVSDSKPPPGRYQNIERMSESERFTAVARECDRAVGHMRRAVALAHVAGLRGLDDILDDWIAWKDALTIEQPIATAAD